MTAGVLFCTGILGIFVDLLIPAIQAARQSARQSAREVPWKTSNAAGLKAYGQGRYGEAEKSFRIAIKEAEKFGPEGESLGASLNNLGLVYSAQGKYAEAEPLYKRALVIVDKVLGPEHPSVATGLNNLAALYDAQGRYTEAEPLYRRSLAIDEKSLGPEHPDLAASLNNLAWLYATCPQAECRDGTKAVAHASRACELRNWKNLICIAILAAAYAEAEDFDAAVKWQTKALELAPDDEELKAKLRSRRELYQAKKPYREDKPPMTTNVDVAYRTKSGLNKAIFMYTEDIRLNPKDAKAYYNRGLVYGREEVAEFDKAIADFTEAIKLDPKDASAYYNRGLAYYGQSNYDKASADFVKARELGYDPK